MNNITAVIITKNEEGMIRDCIESINFVDQILVIDSQSSDKTRQISKNLGAKVVIHPFIDFSESRNFALKQVKTVWVMFIDADERVSKELKNEIIKAVTDKEYSAYSYLRKNYYLGKEWPYKETVTKLIQKDKLTGFTGVLHESPQISGGVKKLSGDLLHYTHRSLEEMIEKTIVWSEFEAKLRFASNHPIVTWWRLIRVFLTGFYSYYFKQQGFKAGSTGLIESIYQGFSMFITYTRLWELQKGIK